mmetsp:Transcript_20139/g.57782  ORF Transcript_20139/g.57782 Transcript_20139/m.57782 type:complete len:208 (-) Transcript_20139:18-641(-)
MSSALWRAVHSFSDRSKYFSVTISNIGPTFCDMPPWTRTSEFRRASRSCVDASSSPKILCDGTSLPLLMPHSGSPSSASTPVMSFNPGQTPPLSCQPPPLPPSHSPRMARAATSLRSSSRRGPVSDEVCPVALIQTAMMHPNKLVETARRDPLGISFTFVTNSIPFPPFPVPPINDANTCSKEISGRHSRLGGTMPLATMPALSRPT